MKAHFVTFYSPGTFVAEDTTKPIDAWDPDVAAEMAHEIVERHGATPYAFQFSTRERSDTELDSRVTERSPTYFLGGEIWTVDDVRRRNDPNDRILLSNMEGNHYDRVVHNTNSWTWTQPLEDGDVVLDWSPRPKPEPIEAEP